MGVVFVQWRYNAAYRENTCSTALVPPLVAAPQFLFLAGWQHRHLLVDERLTAKDQLITTSRCLREFGAKAIRIVGIVVRVVGCEGLRLRYEKSKVRSDKIVKLGAEC